MTEPLCPYFGKCGGCNTQHIDYKLQLENKKNNLMQKINYQDISVRSDQEYNYRSRIDCIFMQKGLGFRQKGNPSSVIPIDSCAICNKRINELIKELNSFFRNNDDFDLKRKVGTLRYAVIRASELKSSISFVLNSDSKKISDAMEKIESYAKISTADNIVIAYVEAHTEESISEDNFIVKGSEELLESYLGKKFYYDAQGFFQNNHKMAEKMQEYVKSILSKYPTNSAHLLDLYGGVGTFGIINSEIFKTVTIVEGFSPSIESAKKNILENKVMNAKALVMDAKNLRKVLLQKPLYVITDPPRSGMDQKAIDAIKNINPEVIIYISCNIEQLAKELPKLAYKIKSAALFDLFPQTNHCEAVIELVR